MNSIERNGTDKKQIHLRKCIAKRKQKYSEIQFAAFFVKRLNK